MLPSYKTYWPAEFVNRDIEFEQVNRFLDEKNRGVIIFEGERGSGKTSLLFEEYRRFLEQPGFRPFLISLSPYSAPEFTSQKNVWINAERPFEIQDIPGLLDQLARYLEIDFIESRDPNIQKEYLARGLAFGSSKIIPILLMDSIYECPDATRVEIEKYVLAPILTSERVFILLSGRGKRPVWSRPELQTAEIIELPPLKELYVKEQLERMHSLRAQEYHEIADLSGGYPLIVHIMGKSEKALDEALSDAINVIIKDTLPEDQQKVETFDELRTQIEKLALVNIPFRIPDVEDYLYPGDSEQRARTNQLINLLLASHILRYEGKGYQLNQSIIHPIRKWLQKTQQTEFQVNLIQLKRVSTKLQENYPSAKTWYQGMIPEGLHSSNRPNLPNHFQARYTA